MIFNIIYQHTDFIIIDKPEGISVHKDDADVGLTTLVAQQLNCEQVWLVHRLDKLTSGLLILALNASSARILSELFAQHRIEKTYLALSNKKPKKKQGTIKGDMQKARRGAWKLCHSMENPAVTRFQSYHCAEHLRLFVLLPKTGKTHQLRVAMKSLGSPILGDHLYGGDDAERLHLHAYQLKFNYLGDDICVQSKPKTGRFLDIQLDDILLNQPNI